MKSTSKGNGTAMPKTQQNLLNVTVLTPTQQAKIKGGDKRFIIEDLLAI
jgi:hypothetical protein